MLHGNSEQLSHGRDYQSSAQQRNAQTPSHRGINNQHTGIIALNMAQSLAGSTQRSTKGGSALQNRPSHLLAVHSVAQRGVQRSKTSPGITHSGQRGLRCNLPGWEVHSVAWHVPPAISSGHSHPGSQRDV